MASSKTITSAFEKLPEGGSSFECQRAEWRGCKGGEVATLFFFSSFSILVPSSSSFLGSDGILSKQDQGRAVILRDSQRPQQLSERNT